MSTLRRTPVNFPRMKVRGRRNKAKTAKRVTHLTMFPHTRLASSSDGSYVFVVGSASSPPEFRIESRTTVDGWGRRVREEADVAPEPKPTPRFSFEMRAEWNPEIHALITGSGS